MSFYDGSKLLNMKDLDGKQPEIFMVVGNRSTGKTTFFNKKLIDDFLNNGKKFGLIYRYKDDLDNVADSFFKDIQSLFFNTYELKSVKRCKGHFVELFLGTVSCGYALALNSADKLKRYSHLLSDISVLLFDEFQTETGSYCPKEIEKFISLHTSIARGNGKSVRYLPVIMLSNTISLLNPYFVKLGITERLKKDTKFLRGNGFVLEQNHNDFVADLQKNSRFNIAFSNSEYVAYASENKYLSDNESFIERPKGNSRYLCTIKYLDREYGIYRFDDLGLLYCCDKFDKFFPLKIAVTTDDHNINYVVLRNNDYLISTLRYFFEKGCFRFQNLLSKKAILTLLCYWSDTIIIWQGVTLER